MARQPRLDRELKRYLVNGETPIVAVRLHWFALHREILMAVAATAFAFWVDLKVPDSSGGRLLHNLSLLLWWSSLGWLVWKVFNWRHEWFVATDKRFLLFYGIIRRKVGMMPLLKVTDMTYDRSLLGRIIGYGTFVLESAGQGQALSVIDHVPDAETHYVAICTQLFGSGSPGIPVGGSAPPEPPHDEGPDGPDGWGGPGDTPAGPGGVGGPSVAASSRSRPDPTADVFQRSTPEWWYRSSNLDGPSRLGDTGEIPVVRVPEGAREPWSDEQHAPDEQDTWAASAGGADRVQEIPLYPPPHWSER